VKGRPWTALARCGRGGEKRKKPRKEHAEIENNKERLTEHVKKGVESVTRKAAYPGLEKKKKGARLQGGRGSRKR